MTGIHRPVDTATCNNCRQPTLQLFLAVSWHGTILIGHCPECDAGHCPRCHRHTPAQASGGRARFCTECGASLALSDVH